MKIKAIVLEVINRFLTHLWGKGVAGWMAWLPLFIISSYRDFNKCGLLVLVIQNLRVRLVLQLYIVDVIREKAVLIFVL